MNYIRKIILSTLLIFAEVSFSLTAGNRDANKAWKDVAKEMQIIIEDAYTLYINGNADAGYERVNDAYFGHYEVDGFERNTQSRIGGSRAGNVEVQFSRLKTAIRNGKTDNEVRKEADTLIAMLFEDAEKLDPPEMEWTELAEIIKQEFSEAAEMYLDGHVVTAEPKFRKAYARYYGKSKFQENVIKTLSEQKDKEIVLLYNETKKMLLNREEKPVVAQSLNQLSALISKTADELTRADNRAQWWGTVLASIMILLREGFEAILIVGAIIAYLRKNETEDLNPVYKGSLWGIIASIIMAVILISLTKFGFESGQGQEVIEGITMFVAVAVLFYTSNWMLSKSSSAAWSSYIKGKVQNSIDKNSMFGLAFTCFLAVFREGAEVILFYQAMFAGSSGKPGVLSAVILGIAISIALLVFVYKAIILTGKKLPLKPFFLATSILMFVMVVAFVGGGISEFVDAGWINPRVISGVPTISLLGIYPYAESLIGQGIALLIVILSLILGFIPELKKRLLHTKEC
ncbi:MAG: FTR1 family iron permease [Treponema sp.]|nr:FTR1 family iron permease [Treponema sp.]